MGTIKKCRQAKGKQTKTPNKTGPTGFSCTCQYLQSKDMSQSAQTVPQPWERCGGGGGGTPLFGLYGDVLLDRVWFFGLAVLNRVYSFTCLCSKQDQNLSLTGYGLVCCEMLTGHYKVIDQHHIIFWTRMLLILLSVKIFSVL